MRTTSRSQSSKVQCPASPVARIEAAVALVAPSVARLKRELAASVSDEHLASFGHEGALSAARTFDPSLGVPFERWASLKIRGKLFDGLRACGPLPRRFYRQLRALQAAYDTEERGIEGEHASQLEGVAACLHVSSHLAAMATSMGMGALLANDTEILEAIEDEGGTLEDEVIREELKAHVRAAVTARPERERQILERYYFQEMTLVEASGGLSRGWSSRLLAQATVGVGKTLRAQYGWRRALPSGRAALAPSSR
jgi:RNA polymerase sigma factor for flagellar operon FliA